MRAGVVVVAGLLLTNPAKPSQQVELDRTVERVYGSVIMASDVRQVRLLKLADADTDTGAQTAIENRLLILREATQTNFPEPPADRIAARREAWQRTWPAATDFAALLARAGMSSQALDGWFRDELRIEGYVEQRFPQSDPRRTDRINTWINDLRRRANLSAK
jgi:hypothetical protein